MCYPFFDRAKVNFVIKMNNILHVLIMGTDANISFALYINIVDNVTLLQALWIYS